MSGLRGRIGRRAFLRGAAAVTLGSISGAVLTAAAACTPRRPVAVGSPPDGAAADTGLVSVTKYCSTMGSIASITVYGNDERECRRAIATAFAEMKTVDRLMSAHDANSMLSLVNREAGRGPVRTGPELPHVLERAGYYHGLTQGHFDVTVGPLQELLGFLSGRSGGPYPTDRDIARALALVGFGHVILDADAGTVALAREGCMIDPGGIGVGYAVDRAAEVLRSHGISAAVIDHSGDIYALGSPPGLAGWEISIRDPLDPDGVVHTVSLRDAAISTSGNYEKFVDTARGRIGHILDPLTGESAANYLSVSAIAGSALAADALSTGVFASGHPLAPGGTATTGGAEFICILPDAGETGKPAVQLFR